MNINDLVYESMCIGLHNNSPIQKFNKSQIIAGQKIEREHTKDPEKALAIAKDHLSEIPDYYTRLKKMEKEADDSKSM